MNTVFNRAGLFLIGLHTPAIHSDPPGKSPLPPHDSTQFGSRPLGPSADVKRGADCRARKMPFANIIAHLLKQISLSDFRLTGNGTIEGIISLTKAGLRHFKAHLPPTEDTGSWRELEGSCPCQPRWQMEITISSVVVLQWPEPAWC